MTFACSCLWNDLCCSNPTVQCHFATPVASSLRLSFSTYGGHWALQSGGQYTGTPFGLVNGSAQQNVTFQYTTDVRNHEGAWCNGVGRHLFWTTHTSAFLCNVTQMKFKWDQLSCPLLSSIVWPGTSLGRRVFLSSAGRRFHQTCHLIEHLCDVLDRLVCQ